jgi:HTH-type transcriptional regulator, sugar sensing transcriptional regulator
MLVQKDFLDKIKDFGLNSYEGKIWTALLSRGVSTAGELSDIANVPRSRSYDVLESLEKKGFVIMKIGKPIKYIAVPPKEVIERVKKRLVQDAEYKQKVIAELNESEILDELTLLHNQGVELVEPTDLAGSVKGRDNIYNHLELMINSACESVIMVTTEQGFLRKAHELKKVLSKAKERGVIIRIAVPITNKTKDVVNELKDIAEIRNMEEVKARFVVIDEKELIFMLLDDEKVHPTYDVGIWVNTEFFTNALVGLFDLSWKNMKKITVKN